MSEDAWNRVNSPAYSSWVKYVSFVLLLLPSTDQSWTRCEENEVKEAPLTTRVRFAVSPQSFVELCMFLLNKQQSLCSGLHVQVSNCVVQMMYVFHCTVFEQFFCVECNFQVATTSS